VSEQPSYGSARQSGIGRDSPFLNAGIPRLRREAPYAGVRTLAPDSALVEDASFWRAVALARGKRIADALSAFREFLDGYARSARAGEASAALDWLLVDARL